MLLQKYAALVYNFDLINYIENDNLYNRIHCFLIHY